MSRRALLRTGGGAAAALGLGAGAAVAVPRLLPDPDPILATAEVLEPFHGPHQAGVTTGRQNSAAFAAFTLRPGIKAADAQRMMRLVSDDAARLTRPSRRWATRSPTWPGTPPG